MHLPSSAVTGEADLLPVALLFGLYDPGCGYRLLQQAGYKYAGIGMPAYTCKGKIPDIRWCTDTDPHLPQ